MPWRYPYVATEVLCSEIWSIVDTCVNSQEQLLVPFWETVLDKSPEEVRSQVMMAAHFAKVNVAFLSKKPAEVNSAPHSSPPRLLSRGVSDARVHSSATRHCRTHLAAHRDATIRGSARAHHSARRAPRLCRCP